MKTTGILGGMSPESATLYYGGCTEIPLLLQPEHCQLLLFNTALLHAGKALRFAVQAEQ
jgi:aspartate/glutamate racemase